ncbi:hypothetical protein [Cupriavidus sp. DL-D2]|uniref:hypothetical protein n=1 Tax=Cupriavidus sp. DL-D2 TaxID=3144974 RepID=UPI003213223D
MNLRILKKLSKRAAPLLPLLGDDRKQFAADKYESYTCTGGHDRKHWERNRSIHATPLFRNDLHYRPKHGLSYVSMRQPVHPLKGTIMVGAMCGYYEPEWEEETAWESLRSMVLDHFTEWVDVDGDYVPEPKLMREFFYPTQVFDAAEEIIEKRALRGLLPVNERRHRV